MALVELSILKATLNCCKAVWLRFKVGISFFELTHFCLKIRRRLFEERMTFVLEGENEAEGHNPGQKIDQNHQSRVVNIAKLKMRTI